MAGAIDSSQASIDRVRGSVIHYRHNLGAVRAFVTCENVNGLLAAAGMTGDIALPSIDIDGDEKEKLSLLSKEEEMAILARLPVVEIT